MRITDRMIMSTVMDNIINNQRKLEELQAQISSGRRIRRPADDPVAVGQSLKLSTDLRQMDQYRRNIATAQSWLRSGEVALQELTTVLQRVFGSWPSPGPMGPSPPPKGITSPRKCSSSLTLLSA